MQLNYKRHCLKERNCKTEYMYDIREMTNACMALAFLAFSWYSYIRRILSIDTRKYYIDRNTSGIPDTSGITRLLELAPGALSVRGPVPSLAWMESQRPCNTYIHHYYMYVPGTSSVSRHSCTILHVGWA